MASADFIIPSAAPQRFAYVRQLWGRREFIVELAKGNLDARSSQTALGRLWWLLNPLIMSGVYFIVFGFFLTGSDRSHADFLAYLIIGVFVYRYLSQGLLDSSKVILNNEKLIVDVWFPRLVLPLTAVLQSLWMFLMSLPVLFLLVTPISCIRAVGNADATCVVPTWRMAILPVAIVLLGCFSLGASSLVARWVVPVRDVRDVIPHITRIWFYFSPILWDTARIERFPGVAQTIIKLNPMYSFLSLFRFAMISEPISPFTLIMAIGWAGLAGVVGVWVFVRNEGAMARYL